MADMVTLETYRQMESKKDKQIEDLEWQLQKDNDNYQAENKRLEQAKEIIKNLKTLYFSPVVTKDDVKRQDEILNEAEQFLKE